MNFPEKPPRWLVQGVAYFFLCFMLVGALLFAVGVIGASIDYLAHKVF